MSILYNILQEARDRINSADNRLTKQKERTFIIEKPVWASSKDDKKRTG